MATAGLVLGWAAIGLFALLVAVAVLAAVAFTAHGSGTVPASPGFTNPNAMLMPVYTHVGSAASLGKPLP